jgi:CRP-like cAMP-binding protein
LAWVQAQRFPTLTAAPEGIVNLTLQRCPRGRTLFAQGARTPALYAVLSGEVSCRITAEDGSSSVLEHVTPGQLFGLSAFTTGLPSRYEAVATQATQLLAIGPQAYAQLLDTWPGFARALIDALARRFDSNLHLLENARHRNADERLRAALLQLRRERGSADPERPGGWRLAATQTELAQLAGVSRQTANEWVKQQGLEVGYRWMRGT